MNADVGILIAAMFGMSVVVFSAGFWAGHGLTTNKWKDEMIRRRHAVYHWEDGQWYWNEDEPTTPKDPAATKVRQMVSKNDGR